jgi:adenosylcobinamide-GDP ribazoletransferase
MMPYARTEETAKNKTVYRKFPVAASIGLALQGLLPMGFYLWWMQERVGWLLLILIPALVMSFMSLFIWRRLRGYTGDCCGALFLLTELSAYLVTSFYLHIA